MKRISPTQRAARQACRLSRRVAVSLASIGLSLLAGTPQMSLADPDSGLGSYHSYKDDIAGFTLAQPVGWTVRTVGMSIWVENPDKSEYVMAQAFKARPGESPEKCLETLDEKYNGRFNQSRIDYIIPVPARGSEAMEALHCSGSGGLAEARALCSIVGDKGLLYIIAAPTGRYTSEQPKLLHVAKSLAFMSPRGGLLSVSQGQDPFVAYALGQTERPRSKPVNRHRPEKSSTVVAACGASAVCPGIDLSPMLKN